MLSVLSASPKNPPKHSVTFHFGFFCFFFKCSYFPFLLKELDEKIHGFGVDLMNPLHHSKRTRVSVLCAAFVSFLGFFFCNDAGGTFLSPLQKSTEKHTNPVACVRAHAQTSVVEQPSVKERWRRGSRSIYIDR